MIVNVEITVFTPTYNRAYIINRLYESLQRQEIHNFEWLVVDDGSVDETEELFRTWMNNESKFPIRYYKKKNGGKCRAINFALDLAKGKLFFVVDSDDYLTDDALKKIIAWEKSLPKDEKYCGVAGNLGMSSNFTPNTLFEQIIMMGHCWIDTGILTERERWLFLRRFIKNIDIQSIPEKNL